VDHILVRESSKRVQGGSRPSFAISGLVLQASSACPFERPRRSGVDSKSLCRRVLVDSVHPVRASTRGGLAKLPEGKGRMNLRQRQVPKFPRDFFRNQTHVVPLSDSANRDTRPGNARPPTANVRASRDQTTYLGHGCHDFKYNPLTKPPTESVGHFAGGR